MPRVRTQIEPAEIIRSVYQEIGLSEPDVRYYDSAEDLISDFSNWKREASPFVATYWEYQYPILNPYSYWAWHHLYEEGFQFDLTRSPNEYGAYVYANYKSKIPIEPKYLYYRYLSAAVDAVKNNPKNEVDRAAKQIIKDHEEFYDEMFDILDNEEPDTPLGPEDYLYLGSFSWLRIERDMLHDMRSYVRKPACDEHYQNVKQLCDSNYLFFTFRRLVLCTPLLIMD